MTIAEESTAWPGVTRPTHLGGLGFGLKWNMGWMHDTLGYVSREPIHRQYHHNEMTFSLMYAWSEHYVLPISHDEVVHGKGSLIAQDARRPLAAAGQPAGLPRLHVGAPRQAAALHGLRVRARTRSGREARGLDWWLLEFADHRGRPARGARPQPRLPGDTRPLWERDHEPGGFEWIDANDAAGNVFSWLRWGADGPALACVANFSAGPHEGYRLGLPFAGRWTEVLNTDAHDYGGRGVGQPGRRAGGRRDLARTPASAAVLRLPPLATVWLRRA